MVKTVHFLINSSHHRGNNKYVYNLRTPLRISDSDSVALISASFFNCIYNIKSSWGNNRLVILSDCLNINAPSLTQTFIKGKGESYTDPNTLETINKKYIIIDLDDGYYGIDELNLYFENIMQQIGFYLNSTSEQTTIMHFIQAITNPTKYGVQVNLYTIPNEMPFNFEYPSHSCFTLPNTSETISIYFPDKLPFSKYGSLSNIFGFNPATLLPLNNIITQDSYNLSTITPKVSPVTSYVICCNLINNDFSNPSNILGQLSLGDTKFGGIAKYENNPEYVTTSAITSTYIEITLFDELFNPLELLDNQMSIILGIKFNN